MRSRKWLVLACFVVAISGPSGQRLAFGQPDEGTPRPKPPREVWKIERQHAGGAQTMRGFEFRSQPDAIQEIQDAAAQVRDAESDSAREEAGEKLVSLLDKYFEEDMKRRAEELAAVEARVKKLRALLEKRKSKKQEIIDLQIKVLENEADGLGFFNNSQQSGLPGMGGMGRMGTMGQFHLAAPSGDIIMSAPTSAEPMLPGTPPPTGGGYGGRRGYGVSGGAIRVDPTLNPPAPPKPARPATPARPRPTRQPRAEAAGPADREATAEGEMDISVEVSSDEEWSEN